MVITIMASTAETGPRSSKRPPDTFYFQGDEAIMILILAWRKLRLALSAHIAESSMARSATPSYRPSFNFVLEGLIGTLIRLSQSFFEAVGCPHLGL
jgi:hypothetical protein